MIARALLALALVAGGANCYNLNNPDADHTEYAIQMDGQGDMVAAIKSFRAAAKFAPNSAEAWSNLGLALQDPGNPTADDDDEEARAAVAKSEALDASGGGGGGGGGGGAAAQLPKAPKVASDTTGEFRFYNEMLSWEDAREYCKDMGGTLATLGDQQKSMVAADKCKSKRCWIGLNDRDKEGDFRWASGSPLRFKRWLKYEPNNAYRKEPTQNCGYIWGGGGRAGYGRDGQWGDGECERLHPFLCDITGEKRKKPKVAGSAGGGTCAAGDDTCKRPVPGMVGGKCVCRKKLDLGKYERDARCHVDLSRPQIDEDLGIWSSAAKEYGYKISREYMDETIKKGHLHFMIKGGRLYSRVQSVSYLRDDWIAFLQAVLRNVDVPDVEFGIEVLDRPVAMKHDYYPIFHHVKTAVHSEILVPHPWHYLDLLNIDEAEHENRDMSTKNEDFDTWLFPWDTKADKMIWRGSPNGGDMRPYNWRYFPRNKLVALGHKHPEQIDAGYSEMQVMNQFMTEQIKHLQADFKGYMWEPEWQKAKYIAVVDGIGMSIRYAGVMMTNSVPVKHDSPYKEFFYDWVKPMEHYVPFNYSMADLVDKVKWLQANPATAKKIAYDGSVFMRKIYRTQEVICYMARVLDGFSKLLDYEVVPDARFEAHADYECPC